MWQQYQMAKTWQTRPSEFIGLEGGWTAHDFDSAVHYFGSAVQYRLDAVTLDDAESKASNSTQLLRNKVTGELRSILESYDAVFSEEPAAPVKPEPVSSDGIEHSPFESLRARSSTDKVIRRRVVKSSKRAD